MEWFRSLSEVPGVEWTSPKHVSPDPRLAAAQPIADSRRDPPFDVVWVDDAGKPIGDDYRSYASPARLMLEERWQIDDSDDAVRMLSRDPEEAIRVACEALALPGRRSDYHEALCWLPNVEGVPGTWVELALRADVQLVLADPAGALSSPWAVTAGTDPDAISSQASQPILRLITLYLTEGFLLEAAQAETLLERLPAAARPRHEYWKRPAEVASALRGLA